MTNHPLPIHHETAPHFSLVSILAIVAAVASFYVSWGAGLFLAIVAIVLGLVGVVLSVLPGTRGGVMSVLAALGGAVGIVAAVCRLVF